MDMETSYEKEKIQKLATEISSYSDSQLDALIRGYIIANSIESVALVPVLKKLGKDELVKKIEEALKPSETFLEALKAWKEMLERQGIE
ncbi:MAG: hypothetical protein HY831_03340 [Candidatus Aenigmarchaeota archaeon]|nr:hypothetical protein [Candidatus Aenigmarchaeota archaeon]